MYDYLSIDLPPDSIDSIREILDFHFQLSETGEPKLTRHGFIAYSANIQNMIITYYERNGVRHWPKLRGSIHKYFEGGTNFKTFDINQFNTSINELGSLLGVDLLQCKVNALEYGYNLNTGAITPNEILNSILAYRGRRPEFTRYKSDGLQIRFNKTQYAVKIYNKSAQFVTDGNNILRTELKVTRMQFLTSQGVKITRVSDLSNMAIGGRLHLILKECINQTIFASITRPESFRTKKEGVNFANWQNSSYWDGLNSRRYNKVKEYYLHALKRNNLETHKTKIIDLIQDSYKITTQGKSYANILSKKHLVTIPVKCLQCGKDISKQKKGSKYCSEKIYGKEAKSCRNKVSNPKHNKQRKRIRLEQRTYLQHSLFPVLLHY
jgi:hypothetical protein